MSKIGVFDSGIGGKSVAQAIERALPNDEVIFVNDAANMPYGDKSKEELLVLCLPILQGLVNQGCQLIVIACNTVTTTLIADLRERLPVPLVGMEPMVKPAALATKSGIIAVCATPGTLASERYKWLKTAYADNIEVLEPDCNQWAHMIENNQVNEKVIESQVNDMCDKGADVIVLGCTHYHWIEEKIQQMAKGRARIIQPEQAIIEQVRRVLLEEAE